jgi:hypothetical protein
MIFNPFLLLTEIRTYQAQKPRSGNKLPYNTLSARRNRI